MHTRHLFQHQIISSLFSFYLSSKIYQQLHPSLVQFFLILYRLFRISVGPHLIFKFQQVNSELLSSTMKKELYLLLQCTHSTQMNECLYTDIYTMFIFMKLLSEFNIFYAIKDVIWSHSDSTITRHLLVSGRPSFDPHQSFNTTRNDL